MLLVLPINLRFVLDYAVLIFEKGTYTTIKLSVLFFYRRIFKSSRTFKILNTTLIIIIIIWGVTFLFVPAFLCGADSNHGHPCPQTEWESLWFGITDVIGDVAVLCLPYPILRSLQMDRRQKIGVCAIFLLGTISLIMGIVRLGFVAKTFAVYFHPSVLPTSPSRTPPTFWTTIEVCTGVLAACLPPCSPLLRLGAQKLVSSKYLSRPSPLEERPSFGFGAGKPVGNSFGSSRSSGASGGKETGREKYEIDQVEVFGMKDMV
ncbi:MAG: hypothetical protein MMC33_000576 [Icmadophila ericetorum]|nr:hypothetical protein [Icmadophila ericetorum]